LERNVRVHTGRDLGADLARQVPVELLGHQSGLRQLDALRQRHQGRHAAQPAGLVKFAECVCLTGRRAFRTAPISAHRNATRRTLMLANLPRGWSSAARAAVAAIALTGAGMAAANADDISGAGATFPAPIYTRWAELYHGAGGPALNYQAIGSGAGVT